MSLAADGPNEFICPECGSRCTKGAITGRELGHSNGVTRRGERCPRQPDACDSNSKADPPSYWGGAGFGEVSGDE